MKPSTKGALLSGLIFPGIGQMSLGHRALGMLFIIMTVFGMTGIICGLIRKLPPLVQQVMREAQQGGMDYSRIFELSFQVAHSHNWWLEKASIYMVLLAWIVSTGHAFIAGEKQPPVAVNLSPEKDDE